MQIRRVDKLRIVKGKLSYDFRLNCTDNWRKNCHSGRVAENRKTTGTVAVLHICVIAQYNQISEFLRGIQIYPMEAG